jgi:hypothetical protein
MIKFSRAPTTLAPTKIWRFFYAATTILYGMGARAPLKEGSPTILHQKKLLIYARERSERWRKHIMKIRGLQSLALRLFYQ